MISCINENVGKEIDIKDFNEVDEDNFILFKEILLNLITKENIDGRNILYLIDSLDKYIDNQEKGYYVKGFLKI